MLRRNTLCRARSRKIPSIAKGVGNKLVGVTSTITHVFTGRDTGRPLQIAAMSSPVMPDIWPKMSSTTDHRQLVVQVAWDGTGASPVRTFAVNGSRPGLALSAGMLSRLLVA